MQEREYDRLPRHLRKEWERAPTKVDANVSWLRCCLDVYAVPSLRAVLSPIPRLDGFFPLRTVALTS